MNEKFASFLQAASLLKAKRHLISCANADYVATHPNEALKAGREYVETFLERRGNGNRFLMQWKDILDFSSVHEICAILRDTSDATEQLRLSAPVFRVMPKVERDRIFDAVYGSQIS